MGQTTSVLEVIPRPEEIRNRLAAVVTEATLLRKLLRVSEEQQRARERLERLAHGTRRSA